MLYHIVSILRYTGKLWNISEDA